MTSNHIPQRAIGAKNYPCAQGMAAKEARAIGKYISDAGGGNQYFVDDSDISKLKANEKYLNFLGRKWI